MNVNYPKKSRWNTYLIIALGFGFFGPICDVAQASVEKVSISKRLDLELDNAKWEWFKSTTFYTDGLWIIRKKGQIQPLIYFRYDLSHLQINETYDEEAILKKVCQSIATGPTMLSGTHEIKTLFPGKVCWSKGQSLIPGKGQIRLVWIAPFGATPTQPPVYLTHQAVMHFKTADAQSAESMINEWVTHFKVVAP